MENDASVIADLIHEYARVCEDAAGSQTIFLNPPASSGDVKAFRDSVGGNFPEELAQLYAVADGEDGARMSWLFPPFSFLPVRAGVGLAAQLERGFRLSGSGNTVDPVYRDPRVQPSRYNVGWIPFARRGDGAVLAVDTVPSPEGAWGQIVNAAGPAGTDPEVVASSLADPLRTNIRLVSEGSYRLYNQDGEEFMPGQGHDAGGNYTVEPEDFAR